MEDNRRYFVVTEKAVPDVLLKVVEAKRLLEVQKFATVQEAVESAEVPFTNIKMIFFLLRKRQRDRILLLSYRWTMSQGFFLQC